VAEEKKDAIKSKYEEIRGQVTTCPLSSSHLRTFLKVSKKGGDER
jgi:hypothetical protein